MKMTGFAIALWRVACTVSYHTCMPDRNKEATGQDSWRWPRAVMPLLLLLILTAAWYYWPQAKVSPSPMADPHDADPLMRVAACQHAQTHELIALASDTDWRVRAAAYEALSTREPMRSDPLPDTRI